MNEEEEIIDLAPDQIEKETYNELIQHENTLVYPIIIGSNIKGGTVKNVTINETSTIGGVSGSTIANIGAISADITPTGLSVDSTGITISDDGTVSAYVVLSWNAINTSTFDRYRIRYKKGTFTYYQYISTNETTILIDGLTPNTSYNFGIASVNKYGTLSAFSSDIASTTATSTVPPVTVVGVSAVSGIQYAIVEWAANSEKDIAHYNIYRNTVNNPATATRIASIKGTYLVDGNLTGGQIYYYWLKAVNTSGLLSTNFSTAASTTPRDTGLGDISEGAALAMFGWTQSCVFSTDGRTKVNWTSGTLKTAGNKTYNITAGTTGIMTAKTYIYLDINVSTTTYQITTTATNTVGLGKLLVATAENVAEADGSEASFRVIDGDMKLVDALVANSIKASHISAGAITTTELNFTPVQDINVIASINASAEGVDISASKIATLSAEKILIDGDVYLSNWRSATDMTKIDGGNIYTGTVTTTQLSFTPVQNTDVIAKINASEEGIRIDADNIEISGSTTFASGYDPTGRVLAVGGSYDTASSGARVRIFPDSNTGIQIIDDSSKDVFKAMIGGDNVGDVIIGDYSGGQGIFYDKSENKTTFAGLLGSLTIASSGHIKQGQTAYDTGTGFWLGDVSGTPKFSIGNPSGSYLKFDGTSVYLSDIKFPESTTSGSNWIATAANEVWTKATSAKTVKELTMGIAGYVTFSLAVKSTDGSEFARFKIYKNEIIEDNNFWNISTQSTSYSTQTANTTVSVGDKITVTMYTDDGTYYAYCKDFRVGVSKPPFPLTFASLDSANEIT